MSNVNSLGRNCGLHLIDNNFRSGEKERDNILMFPLLHQFSFTIKYASSFFLARVYVYVSNTFLFKHWNDTVILCSLHQHVGLYPHAFCVRQLGDECTYFSVVFVDVLVVGHLHQAMAQVVVGEDEETGLQVTVDFFQILKEKNSEE